LSTDYSQGSESVKAEYLNGSGGSGCAVIGLVDTNQTVIGLVNC
jgi:hypothetical protein